MNTLQKVVPQDNYKIKAFFHDGKVVLYDMKPILDAIPSFRELKKNESLYHSVSVSPKGDMVVWDEHLNLSADTIYKEGIVIEVYEKKPDINRILAYNLRMTRKKIGLTQNALSEKTGISQADISRIERGIGNPSLDTLSRLADGLEMNLNIEFYSKIMEGLKAIDEGRVSTLEEVKERTRKRWRERGYSDFI